MPSAAASTTSFAPDRLARLASMEEDHFWSRSRRRLVLDLLRRHLPTGASVLDAGCGTGRLLSDLEQQRYRVTGLDILPDAVLRARTRLDGGRAELRPFLPFQLFTAHAA